MINDGIIDTTEVTVIGAGLTGLTTAFWLRRKGIRVHVIETDNRIGGQIRTERHNHYIYETGPSTGAVSTPEVAELMQELYIKSEGKCRLETAPDAAKKRLIWKGDRFRALPSGPVSALTTPLFRFTDKLRILGEPWRKRGNNPDESVGMLAARRLGRSYVDYAVDPFISGVYAGDPYQLVTRYALPKLYALERDYGSFIRGSIARMRQPKTDRDRLATKKVFSALGGLSHITEAEADYIGRENITTGVSHVRVSPMALGWLTAYTDAEGTERRLQSRWVVTTCGAYNLPELLPFVDKERMDAIASLKYAPVNGEKAAVLQQRRAFTNQSAVKVKAVRSAVRKSLIKRHDFPVDMSDEEVKALVREQLHTMLKFPGEAEPDFIHISRHRRAIPQYHADSGRRFSAVQSVQDEYRGLMIAGNLRDGIGMGHRITQATNIAKAIIESE